VSFNPESGSTTPDFRIRNTVIHLIQKFIEEQRAPVLYVCDNLDHREFSRQRLFSKWFDKAKTSEFQHDYRVVKFEDYTVIFGIVSFQWDAHFDHYFEQIEHV
jgi:hypothetical protein